MTTTTTDLRTEIMAALDSVAGVTGSPSAPNVITAGSGVGWPTWLSTSWINDWVRERAWHVFVVMPGTGDVTTLDYADPLVEAVGVALWELGHVDIVEPVSLTAGASGDVVPALRFRLVTH